MNKKTRMALAAGFVLATAGSFLGGYLVANSSNPLSYRSVAAAKDPLNRSSLGEFDLGFHIDPKYPLARSAAELSFIKPAIATCDMALAQGAVLTPTVAGTSVVILPTSARNGQAFGEFFVSADGNWAPVSDTNYLCDIKDRNTNILRDPASVSSIGNEHVVDNIGDGDFAWHAHTQSPELGTDYWSDLSGGVFNTFTNSFAAYKITFGITAEQLDQGKAALKVALPNG